jgi:NADPH:quinone reductase
MVLAACIHRHGGPAEIRIEEIELAAPGAGEARIRHTAIAVNFSDINLRRGGFYLGEGPRFPLILGNEAAGVIESIGPGVSGWRVGERACYVGVGGPFYQSTGAYAQARNVPAGALIRLPDAIADAQAAALMLKGLTASMIINRIFRPKPGQTILVHAAASGVGLILSQWIKHLGARVIGTVGSPTKARIATAHGCDHVILYREHDFVAEVKKIVPRGVDAVFDGVGKDTFMRSLDCTAPFGMIVNYGNASGPVPPIDLLTLNAKGSIAVSRPAISHYIDDPRARDAACTELFDLVGRGVLKVEIGKTYRLAETAQAHRDLEAHTHAGALVLLA